MITGPIIAEMAALVGDPARATMVSALLDGRARTASELAAAAHITPQTASTHLAKLTQAGVLSVVRQGRHRHFRLGSPAVGDMLDAIGEGVALLENKTGMHSCLDRKPKHAADRWRGLTVGEFEQRQLRAIRDELDRAHAERTRPAVRSTIRVSPANVRDRR